MEYMFDQDKPHFRVWLRVYNIDIWPTSYYLHLWRKESQSTAGPLYYAALCGFYDIVEHLIAKYPRDVNADGGFYGLPLVAALSRRHFQTADLLCHHGADPHSRGRKYDRTILHIAAFYGDAMVVQKLIEYGADVNAKDTKQKTPLHLASKTEHYPNSFYNPDFFSVHQLLLEHGADVDARAVDGSTPLCHASFIQNPEVVRLLLDHGADVNAREEDGWTPLRQACLSRREPRKTLEVLRMLLDRGADVKAMDIRGRTILQLAQDHFEGKEGGDEIMKLLLDHEAK